MKKLLVASALVLASAMTTQSANAAVAWACKLNASVSGFDGAIIVGISSLSGPGTVKCRSLAGQTTEAKVVVTMIGLSAGPQIAIPTGGPAKLRIYTGNLGLSTPNAMYGEYSFGDGVAVRIGDLQAAAGRAIAVSIHNGLGASARVSVELMQGASLGLGVSYGFKGMAILSGAQYRANKARERAEFEEWKRKFHSGELNP